MSEGMLTLCEKGWICNERIAPEGSNSLSLLVETRTRLWRRLPPSTIGKDQVCHTTDALILVSATSIP